MKLMVCFVGLHESEKEVTYAITRAKAQSLNIHLVTATTNQAGSQDRAMQDAQNELEAAQNSILEQGLACETHLITYGTEPGEDLLRCAKELDIDEIVIGVRSMSKMGKLLFGSTAQYIILKAHCPVVTIKT